MIKIYKRQMSNV